LRVLLDKGVRVYGFRWERWSALAGVLFVALFMLGIALSDNSGDTTAKLQSYYGDSGHRTREFVAFFLIVAAGLAFLSFLGTLRAAVMKAEAGPGTLSGLVFGPGIAFVGLFLAGNAISRAPAALADEKNFKLDGNTAELFNDAGYMLFVSGVMVAAIMVLSVSTSALRTGALPAWLGWVGLIVAVTMLFAIVFIPILIFLAWVLAVSLVMVVAASRIGAAPPPTSTAVG
jgi:magnesium-transporting ATPase (P-type)